jgi:hypothetical protein
MEQISFNGLLDWPRTIGKIAELLWGLLGDAVGLVRGLRLSLGRAWLGRRDSGVDGLCEAGCPTLPPDSAREGRAVGSVRV